MTTDRQFVFRARLQKTGGIYAVDVPERISKAAGKRGPVPVRAVVNEVARFSASISPAGGGRHRLRINTRMREVAGAEAGDLVRVSITVLAKVPRVAMPADVRMALQAEGALEHFLTFPSGKQAHIIDWIERAARPETREKRIRYTVEFTLRSHEKRLERERKKQEKRRPG